MARHVDALTAATLKDLREQWWDAEFSEFLQETLRPRPGTRILDVGCGDGTAELALGRLRDQPAAALRDRLAIGARDPDRAAECRRTTTGWASAAADVRALPFSHGAFDATFCVAVLQHVERRRARRRGAGARHPTGRTRR